ncbi:hypothetical protein CDS [Bradyrhizobium sp.]|nr:hypothetical protein CDS [Bradyrhizobium sp.]
MVRRERVNQRDLHAPSRINQADRTADAYSAESPPRTA